jgi:hypothetical protein
MNFMDHAPAHFHVWYRDDFKAIVSIEDGIVKGEMHQRVLILIFEWLELYKKELLNDWELAQLEKPLMKIEPLK